MKFKEWLDSVDTFSGEIYTEDGIESKYSFEWDKDCSLTDEGYKKFKQLMDSEIRFNNGNIVIQDKISEEMYDLWMAATAGFVATSLFDKWFKEEK